MKVKIGKIKANENNPRYIREPKFEKLVKSIKEFPEMLAVRPIVVDENFIVLGGNMRLKACIEAGITELEINQVKGWTEEQKREFIIKDNASFGEWDWDVLANEWEQGLLASWGLEVFISEEINLDDFFEDAGDNEKETKGKIVLEYSEEDYQIINDKFNSMDGSKENIIWKLLNL